MKKIIFALGIITVLAVSFLPQLLYASLCPEYENAIVPCGQLPTCRCELTDFFVMLLRLFNFIALVIAVPFAGLVILIGGTLILISGINASWYDHGKKMVLGAIIAVVLIFTSWIIMNAVMAAFGFQGAWHTPFGP